MRSTIAFTALTSTAAAHCTRAFLEKATASYLAVQSGGLGPSHLVGYNANTTYFQGNYTASASLSMLTRALKIDHNITTHDVLGCRAFVEIIVTNPQNPYVIGTRLLFSEGNSSVYNRGGSHAQAKSLYKRHADPVLTEIESIATTTGDWAFNATGYLYWAQRENWAPIPAAHRDSRAVIQAAGDAYFDRFANASVVVPWGTPCARLEGGAYTGQRNASGSTCDLGLPSTIYVTDRRYVVDEVMGTVDIFVGFPGLDRTQGETPMPDSHVFRVEGGKIRAIHTLTYCKTPGCGVNFPPP